MGMLDQLKMAQEMMKNMSPEQIQEMMKQAKGSQAMLADQIRKIVDEEINKRNLVSREELEKMLK